MRLPVLVLCAAACALAAAGVASSAQLVDRNVSGLTLKVNTKSEALLTYRANGATRHVLVWGAINARPPSTSVRQVAFKLDYSGGYKEYRTNYWQTFPNKCARYDGPLLPDVIASCKAPDGSYWAVQQWPQALPDLGYVPWTDALRANWMEVSHWSGPVAELTAYTDWVYSGRFQEIFGTYTYGGSPVYGFGTTNVGAPTDSYGRLIYLDTHNAPAYGSGWRRENSFVSHNPTGAFCYGFYTFDPTKGGYQHPPGQTAQRGPGLGDAYRLTAGGPGVTPNVALSVPPLHPFDPNNPDDVAYQQKQADILRGLGDKSCLAGH